MGFNRHRVIKCLKHTAQSRSLLEELKKHSASQEGSLLLRDFQSLGVKKEPGSSVGTVSDWTAGVRSPTEAEDFPSSLCVQTGCGAHPASCTLGTAGKGWPGRDADHSPTYSAEGKKYLELYLLSP
jgi:hypothetical protein